MSCSGLGWTLSTTLLSENGLESDANPVTCGGGTVGNVLSLTLQSAKYGECGEFSASVEHPKTERQRCFKYTWYEYKYEYK